MPKDEKFALIDQLKRASTSVTLNIAEGCGSGSDKEFRSFLRIALKSLYETVAGLKLSDILFDLNGESVYNQAELVGKQLNGFIKSLKVNN